MMDDTGVPVIGGMPISEGWKSEMVRVRGRGEDVFISPDGVRYVRAGENERADLIYHRISKRFIAPLHLRLRLQQTSKIGKQVRKEARAARTRVRRKLN